jgi:hypothetical protein
VNSLVRPLYIGVCLLAALTGAACRDSSADPMSLILSDETWGVLATEGHLPSLGVLVAQSAVQPQLAETAQRWSSSWELPAEAGRAIRSAAYESVAAPLATALGEQAVAGHVEALGDVLAAAAELDAGRIDGDGSGNVEAATLRHQEAVTALAAGRHAEALEHTLQASDLLRELGAEGVTRMLLARAEREITRLGGAEALSAESPSEELLRGQRLVRGAEQALAEGDYLRAIQRAFYACQVLGLVPS